MCLTVLIIIYLSLGFSEKKECKAVASKNICLETLKIHETELEGGAVVRLSYEGPGGKNSFIAFERNKLILSKNFNKKGKITGNKGQLDFIIRTRNKKKGIYIISAKDTFGDELFMSVDYSSDNPLKKDIIFKKSSCPEKDNSLKIKIINRNDKKIFKFFDGSFMCCDEKVGFASSVLKKSICEVVIV
jgi:hypothetical protein